MNCHQAQQTLDASRFSQRDWDEPELRDAAQHASGCETCRQILEQREAWDRLIAQQMQSITIPEGLKERLLDELSSSALACNARPAAEVSRRRVWSLVSSSVLLLLACFGWWIYSHRMESLTLDDVYSQLHQQLVLTESPVTIERLPRFDQGFDGQVHDLIWKEALTSEARGLDLDGRTGHDAAVYRFALGRRGSVAGWLIVVGKDKLASPPPSSVPRRGSVRYNPRTHFAWTVGDQVYICILDHGGPDRVLREMFGGVV